MRLVLVGPPGAGKGTQAAIVAQHFAIPHISTGDLFRYHVSSGTPLGTEAKQYLDSGQLVPDSVTNGMVEQRLNEPDAANGFLLDGYPRNTAQVAVLDSLLAAKGWSLDAVVELVVARAEITQRLLQRANDAGRSDDTEEVIAARFDVYDAETAPIVALYRAASLLRVVDGMGTVDEVTKRILDAVDDR